MSTRKIFARKRFNGSGVLASKAECCQQLLIHSLQPSLLLPHCISVLKADAIKYLHNAMIWPNLGELLYLDL